MLARDPREYDRGTSQGDPNEPDGCRRRRRRRDSRSPGSIRVHFRRYFDRTKKGAMNSLGSAQGLHDSWALLPWGEAASRASQSRT